MPSHDVLIIGAGLAGQRAALAAAQAGATVAIISKVHPVRSHSVAAAGGINAALNPEDTWESHAFDTIKGSDYLGDQDAIEIMCREAPGEILWLEHAGVTFHRNETGHLGHPRLRRRLGRPHLLRRRHHRPRDPARALRAADEAFRAQIDRYEEWFTTDLLQDDDGRCIGAICRNLRDGELEVFNAKATILASGGAGQAYKPTTNGLIVTGDGIAQAYRIGARLMDMEMIQYHPTTLAGNGLLITEGARGEGAWLLNAEGERFMEKYAPNKLELASRDVVSRAEQTEINEGRGFPDGTVALDITKVPRAARSRRCGRSSTSAATSPASTSPASRSTSTPASTTSWAGSRPTSTARRRSRGCTPPARWPACRSTAATAWAPTRCSTR